VEVWKDKGKYEGDFDSGFKHGSGRFSWNDGSL
jgi:hypothetical protein